MQLLLTSIYLSLRLVLPGVAWAWCFPSAEKERPGAGAFLLAAGRILVGGVALNAGLAMILAEAGQFTAGPDLAAWLGLSLAGLAVGRARRRAALAAGLKAGGLAALAAAGWFALALALPQRGEWLAGGWDPGVYQQQGIQVARSGTFHPDPAPVYADMAKNEFRFFTRGTSYYREAYPGIPLDRETRAYRHYFFRLTPAFTALLYRVGGLEAALRINLLLAPVAVLGLAAALFRWTRWRNFAGFAALLLAANPVFVYHTHVPTSEILHLVLVCGIGLSLSGRTRRPEHVLCLGVFLGLAVLNRFAFLPFAGALIAAMAWLDLRREDRARCLVEHGAVALFPAAAALFDFKACAVTLSRLQEVTPLLVGVFLAGVAAAVLLDLPALHERFRARLDTWVSAALRWGFLAMVVCGGLLALLALAPTAADRVAGGEDAPERLRDLLNLAAGVVTFLGYAGVVGAVAGGVFAFLRMRTLPRELFAWCLFGAAATAVLVARPGIWGIFPWALRRFVPYTLPLLATLNALWLSRVWAVGVPRLRPIPGPALACCAAVLLLALPAGRTARAWAVTEYNGITDALAAVAAQTEPGDVLVVDSRRWCAPLALVHDLQVLNGERLWYRRDAEAMQRGLGILRRLHDRGYRIRFLTTTGDGLQVYPEAPQARMDWEGPPYRFATVIHSDRARDFALEEREAVFRAWTWEDRGRGKGASAPGDR